MPYKLEFKTSFLLISIFFLLQVLTGCSPESGNPLAKNYHNTTARYNAYFIAKERMKEVEAIMWKNNVDDFNKILNIFPELKLSDTAQIGAAANDCIKKSSIAIQRHKNSKWTDRSFNLIGKSRFYMKDYKNAIETFKYVNTKGKDKDAKHAALINLMRLFIETKQNDEAVAVAAFLRKEKLSRSNDRDLNLVKAYYFAQLKDYKKVESYVGFAIPGVDVLSVRARYYFIIGQIRQMNGENKDAYVSYKTALKNTPSYEIAFYSRLNINQVTDIDNKGDVKRIDKNFAKLLKDIRNEDFKDKIYYEMAKFELKRDKTDKAIALLNQSVRASTINERQKAYSYLLLGQLYYEKLKKYELAKSYYDSTVSLLPTSEAIYDKTLKRQKSLDNFVTQINTIKTEDSLQRLAKMDTVTLNQYLAKIEEDQKAEAERKSTEAASGDEVFGSVFEQDPATASARNTNSGNDDGNSSNASTFYFYSSAALSRGRSEFNKVWGTRPLEDNWRLSKKAQTVANQPDQQTEAQQTEDAIVENTSSDFNRQQFLSQLPRSEEAMNLSNEKIEDAYFVLGKIYDQELDEPANSLQTFETLLKRFPDSEYKPESYYYLHLLNNKLNTTNKDQYKTKLAAEFPNSLYNRLLNNPNYLSDSKKEEKLLNDLYDKAYTLYERENYESSGSLIDSVTRDFPQNIIADKFSLLKVLISGQTQERTVYQANLENFIVSYPESSLTPYAQQLLSRAVGSNSDPVQTEEVGTIYRPDLENKPHYFFILYPAATDVDENLKNDVAKFNIENNANKNLKVELITDDPASKILIVKEFKDKNEALTYYASFKENSSLLNKYNGINLNVFIISVENFETFNQNKDVNSYLSFFEKTY